MNIDDPKLTAFALDELDEPERSTIARAVAASPEAQRYVDETRELARGLKNEFAVQLKEERRAPAHLIDIRDDPWLWSRARPLAIAASIAVFALIIAIFLGQYNAARKSTTDRYAEVDTDEPAATIPNPLRPESIQHIERVVVAEMSGGDKVREIEVIGDAYRLERLRQRLAAPTLIRISPPANASKAYDLTFTDSEGRAIAHARFYQAEDGYVLQPLSAGDYVIPFTDWAEAIGYAPGA